MSGRQFGAVLQPDGTCEWRVWAPQIMQVDLVLLDGTGRASQTHRMAIHKYGFFACRLDHIAVGQRYGYRLNGGPIRPDPASVSQPEGVHLPSAVWRATDFEWTDQRWRGRPLQDLTIYELHVGTFTPEGTFSAIIPRLDDLQDLGINTIELMPVAQFPGTRGWGYDGVDWFAVQNSYGGPSGLLQLVDACHARGIGVILDVIYNHFGPEGNYFGEYGPVYSSRHHTPWGAAINYDGPSCHPVRDFVLDNVRQWIRDFHIDGLRLDAVHAIYDESPTHILAEIKQAADEEAERICQKVCVIAESNLNDVRLLDERARNGYGLDAQWSDDFHHCVHSLLTGELDGYYADFHSPAEQLVKALNDVFVHDGCYSSFRGRNHGAPVGEHSGERFIVNIQTHDQVGNRARGDRFGTLLSPAKRRLAAGLLLLAPHVPMLFMGEEYGETRHFPFFCDFGDEALQEAVRRGRRAEFSKFDWDGELPDPNAAATFESAILNWNWPAGSDAGGLRNLYRTLLSLRRTHPALRNFTRRDARLVPGGNDEKVLLLSRGSSDLLQKNLHAVFNLGDVPVPASGLGDLPGELLLYSDDPSFCGSSEGSVFDGVLRPFAFAVFGNLMEVN